MAPKRSHELEYPCGAKLWHDDLPITAILYHRHARPLGEKCIGCRLHGVMVEDGIEQCLGRVVLGDDGPVRRSTRKTDQMAGQMELF